MKNKTWRLVEEMICEEVGQHPPHLMMRFLTRFEYNAFGSIQKKTTEYCSGSFEVTAYEYDRFFRRIGKRKTVFDSSRAELFHRDWKCAYELSGKNTVARKDVIFTDADGQQTHSIYLYDTLERIVSETSIDRHGTYRKEYIYVADQREAAEIRHYCNDEVLPSERFYYDERGRLSGLSVYDSSEILMCRYLYLYDTNGNMKDRILRKTDGTPDSVTSFENDYDENGNLVHIRCIDHDGDANQTKGEGCGATHYYYKYAFHPIEREE